MVKASSNYGSFVFPVWDDQNTVAGVKQFAYTKISFTIYHLGCFFPALDSVVGPQLLSSISYTLTRARYISHSPDILPALPDCYRVSYKVDEPSDGSQTFMNKPTNFFTLSPTSSECDVWEWRTPFSASQRFTIFVNEHVRITVYQ